MGRHTGPTERLSRREGVDLELKGVRRLAGKGALERRGAIPPGQHGARRPTKPSVYQLQLREKQKLKRFYGLRERQMRRLYEQSSSGSDDAVTGTRILQLLELRLDNVITRLGLAGTRAQARQFVGHGHVFVDGRRLDIPSARLKPGQTVSLGAESPVRPLAQEALELIAVVPSWLQADHDGLAGTVLRVPERDEIRTPVNEQLVVELYSRR